MIPHLPSESAVRGLCAAFFLAPAISGLQMLVNTFVILAQGYHPSRWNYSPLFWLLFAFAGAVVGVRLLYGRPYSVGQGLLFAG
jgi:hypothetical protein